MSDRQLGHSISETVRTFDIPQSVICNRRHYHPYLPSQAFMGYDGEVTSNARFCNYKCQGDVGSYQEGIAQHSRSSNNWWNQ